LPFSDDGQSFTAARLKAREGPVFTAHGCCVGNYSIGTALRQRVYLGAASRSEADTKCAALRQKGVACLVRRTRR